MYTRACWKQNEDRSLKICCPWNPFYRLPARVICEETKGGREREPDGKVNYYLAEGQIFRDDREMEFIRVMDLDIFVSVGVQSVKSI